MTTWRVPQVLLALLLLGGVVLGAAVEWVMHEQALLDDMKRPVRTRMALVAARDLAPGEVLGRDDFFAIEVPWGLPPTNLLEISDKVREQDIVGRVVTHPLLAYDYLRSDDLGPYRPTSLVAALETGAHLIALPAEPALVRTEAPVDVDLLAPEGCLLLSARAMRLDPAAVAVLFDPAQDPLVVAARSRGPLSLAPPGSGTPPCVP